MGRRRTQRRRNRRRGGANPIKGLALVLLAGMAHQPLQAEAGFLDSVQSGLKWLNTKHTPEEMEKAAEGVWNTVQGVSSLKPPGALDALGGIEGVNEKLKALNARLAGESTQPPSGVPPGRVLVGKLEPGAIYADDSGTLFEYDTASSTSSGFEVRGIDPNTRAKVVLKLDPTSTVTLISNPYANSYDLDGEWLEAEEDDPDRVNWVGGSRRRKHKRKTLRRKK